MNFDIDPDLIPMFAGLAVTVLLIAYGTWKAAKPHNSVRPRMIPWTAVTLVLGVVAIVLLVTIASQMGFHPTSTMSP
jgi:hypothetical protein